MRPRLTHSARGVASNLLLPGSRPSVSSCDTVAVEPWTQGGHAEGRIQWTALSGCSLGAPLVAIRAVSLHGGVQEKHSRHLGHG